MDLSQGSRMIIAGDVNAKSVLWHNIEGDTRGDKMEEFIEANNLALLNRAGQPSTFSTLNGQANIDITLTNNFVNLIANWSVEEEWCSSNHRAILMEVRNAINSNRIIQKSKSFNLKSANWEQIKDRMREDFNRNVLKQMTEMQAEKLIGFFNEKVHRICRDNMKFKRQIERKVPWWNKDIADLRKKLNKIRKNIQRYKRLNINEIEKQERKNYKAVRNKYVSQIRKSKTESWKKFVTDIGNKNPWGVVYKLTTGKIKNPEIFHTIKTGQTFTKIGEHQ